MRERKHVKIRIDMYEDTKSKIIDRMPKRDLIHYVWNRLVVLAGKVNQEGDLYMSKNIPYTVETLAIEFNRDIDEIKTALDVLIELEMIELTENKVYRVKNFAKHQNIKVKEKAEPEIKEKIEVNDKENNVNDAENSVMENEVQAGGVENEACTGRNEEVKEKLNKLNVMPLLDYVESNSDDVNKSHDNKENEKTISSQHNNSAVILDMKKNQKTNKKNKKVNKKKINDEIIVTDEDNPAENIESIENIEEEKEEVCFLTNREEVSLKDGEILLSEWAF